MTVMRNILLAGVLSMFSILSASAQPETAALFDMVESPMPKAKAQSQKTNDKSTSKVQALAAALAEPVKEDLAQQVKLAKQASSEDLLRKEAEEAKGKRKAAAPKSDDPLEELGGEELLGAEEGEKEVKPAGKHEAPVSRHLRATAKVPAAAVKPEEDAVAMATSNAVATVSLPSNSSLQEADSMEKTLMDLMKSGVSLGATPFGKSVDQIREVINNEMMPAVLNGHRENQHKLESLAADNGHCGYTKDGQVRKAAKNKALYFKTSPLHKTCREGEAGRHTEKIDCHNEEKDKRNIMELKCKEFDLVEKQVTNQQANGEIVKKAGAEKAESYVRRMTSTICGHYPPRGKGGGGKDGFLDKYMIAKENCQMATNDYRHQVKTCKIVVHEYVSKKSECDSLQDQMDGASCKRAVEMKDACETYAECFFDTHKSYVAAEKMVKIEEADRWTEWKGLKRMECLMNAFGDGKVKNSEIEACKAMKHSTDHLKIVYPILPHLVTCTVPDRYPSTPEYKLAEFASLPALAKGKEDANECTGVVPIPTEPFPGSPKSCKCERVTLNGPYSAGPLVKCSNCTAARRSTDRNSCPEGTKVFSPRSAEDWTTIMSSVGELLDPHFIVDVSRPQAKCKLCSTKAMNSKTTQGREWHTSDGSPWWLRSTQFDQADGHKPYQPNCFLGLTPPFDNVNDLSYAEDACSFHAKSYYCQLKELSIKPKRGSPAACKCENVVLTGHYSAGALIKCTGCLAVARSSQKNSCPTGTKIFSPANARDWKTFLGSAQPLRSPHWIIDVTRPQNGCGGCGKHAMNSKSPPQMTWRTSDGSPWWLRSSKYIEPTKDYAANCYMDLFKAPPSENSVMFKSKQCKYFSNAYYCQPVKKEKKEEATPDAPDEGGDPEQPEADE